MYANNEIGTIEPIKEIGQIAHENGILFHTDAIQAIGKLSINVLKDNIDLLSISSHKIYGPKGVGALLKRKEVKIEPLLHGGGHEGGLRSGTLNTPGIVGLGKACEIAKRDLETNTKYLREMRDVLIKNILKIENSFLNGHPEKRLVNNAHFRFSAIEGESLNLLLDDMGIASATGSACSSKKIAASHVLLAIGLDPTESHGSLRLTLGKGNKMDDITYVSDAVSKSVAKLRKMSPLWKK
jgi:cysteine desulfurase